MPDFAPLWYWIKEREAIRIRKEAGAWPSDWTKDEILKTYRFCNVRREDDLGTRWINEHIRKPYAENPYLWFMLAIARQINWPATLAELIIKGVWPTDEYFNPSFMTEALNARKGRGEKVYTGAYMISAPSTKGANKQQYISETVCGALWEHRSEFLYYFTNCKPSLQIMHEGITRFNGWGPFMAYQAVVDMRFTKLLDKAEDVATWAAAGPGTIRGLNRMHGREIDARLSQQQALEEISFIYSLAYTETNVEMDFSDIPNVLCETDKYLRVYLNQGTPRALYVAGRGS